MGEADILRKAVGKKIPSLLEEQRIKFVKGAVENGHKEAFAKEVFEKVVEPFAGYGFNKAHAACYGLIAYRTAYLKAHYPIEFMTALLCSDAANTDRVVLEIKECTEMGIDVLPPSVNESFLNFTVVDEDKIRFGLLAIKGVGEGPIKEVISARDKGGKFKSIEDFAQRVPSKMLNKKLIQALAYSGAFDEFGDRNQLAENYEVIAKFGKASQKTAAEGQTDIFGMMDTSTEDYAKLEMMEVPKANRMQSLKWEKEYLGMYVSGHPLKGLSRYIARKGTMIANITPKHVDKPVKITGLVTEYRPIITKRGQRMAMFVVEDLSARLNAVIFPQQMKKINEDIREDQVLKIRGKISNRRDQYQIICEEIKVLSLRAMIENAKEAHLFNPEEKIVGGLRLLDDILADQDGLDEVYEIEIPAGADRQLMNSLKSILEKNQGEVPVEVILGGKKRVRLPFGIDLTEGLELKVDSLLKLK